MELLTKLQADARRLFDESKRLEELSGELRYVTTILGGREEVVLAREGSATTRENDVKAREDACLAREMDLLNREKATKNLTQELSQRKARIKTLEEEVEKQEAKIQLARKEKGEVQARLTAVLKLVQEAKVTERSGATEELDSLVTSGNAQPVGPAEPVKA